MYEIETSNKFEKDLKKCIKRGYDISEIETVVDYLEKEGRVPANYRPHKLTGEYNKYWECHIEPDWLLIYDIKDTIRLITLARTGTHSDLF